MKPAHRFHSYVTATTITAMYFVIQELIIPIDESAYPYLKPASALLLSVGTYKFLATILQSTSRKIKFVKRHLLGANYLNGTWVGKFKTSDGAFAYTVEHFEQTLSSLQIRGEAYRESGEPYAQWISLSETIDEVAGSLTYTYNCDKPSEKGAFQGVSVFQFERSNETCGPVRIRGYSADLVDGVRTSNYEFKISEELLPFGEALTTARIVP